MRWFDSVKEWAKTRNYSQLVKDLGKVGFESARFGLATLVVNGFVDKPGLRSGGLALFFMGVILIFAALPKREQDD